MSENFIGIVNQALSKESCDSLIKMFDLACNLKVTECRVERQKNDTQLFTPELLELCSSSLDATAIANGDVAKELTASLQRNAEVYFSRFSSSNGLDNLTSHHIKVQKTNKGEGYHIWHHEASRNNRRVCAWILYLNDVEEGGETEFLYQSLRVKAEQGKLVIFPAGFTHTHRGNPPLSNTKYIATGWFEYE